MPVGANLREFIETMAKALVDHPEMVDVKEISGERTTVFELRVGEGDLGKVIGKGGQTARAMRTLINAVSAKQSKRAVLEIIEPNA